VAHSRREKPIAADIPIAMKPMAAGQIRRAIIGHMIDESPYGPDRAQPCSMQTARNAEPAL